MKSKEKLFEEVWKKAKISHELNGTKFFLGKGGFKTIEDFTYEELKKEIEV